LLRTSFELSTSKKGGPIHSLPLHRAVLDAVIARDPIHAERAIRVLIEGANLDIQEVLARRPRRARVMPARTPTKKKVRI
jgi:DNA-binding FadR family transcriptional regulator